MGLHKKSQCYLDQLERTCKRLARSPVASRKAPSIAAGAEQLLRSLQAYRKNRKEYTLRLQPNWRIELAGHDICGPSGVTELHFGGEIEFKDECLERQVLTVVLLFRSCKNLAPAEGRPRLIAGENHIVRRFHFDFDASAAGRSTPLAHLQVGGTLNQSYLSLSEDASVRYELFDKLKNPRLPWTVTDPALVLDTFLRQFPTDLEEFIAGREWRELVVDSERLWLKDFFRDAARRMERQTFGESLFDYCCTEEAFRIDRTAPEGV